jgi:hypothetical protein
LVCCCARAVVAKETTAQTSISSNVGAGPRLCSGT